MGWRYHTTDLFNQDIWKSRYTVIPPPFFWLKSPKKINSASFLELNLFFIFLFSVHFELRRCPPCLSLQVHIFEAKLTGSRVCPFLHFFLGKIFHERNIMFQIHFKFCNFFEEFETISYTIVSL